MGSFHLNNGWSLPINSFIFTNYFILGRWLNPGLILISGLEFHMFSHDHMSSSFHAAFLNYGGWTIVLGDSVS